MKDTKPKLKNLSYAAWRKIIKRLPRMPIIPNVDQVYHPDLLDDSREPAALNYSDCNHRWVSEWDECSRKTGECYSTRPLAMRVIKLRNRKGSQPVPKGN